MIFVFSESPDAIRPAELARALSDAGLTIDVRNRAIGYRLESAEARWEIVRIRASDLVRELAPRLQSAPAAQLPRLRRTQVGYAIPVAPHGPTIARVIAAMAEGLVWHDGW